MNKALLLFSLLLVNLSIAQAQDYPKSRPLANQGPTQIKTAIFVLDIENIDNKTQSFTLNMVIRLKWEDLRLKDIGHSLPLQSVWHPNVQIYNLRKMEKQFPEIVSITKDGVVQYIQRYQATLSSPLDFREFPFDEQSLAISLLSFGYTPQEVEFVFETAGGGEGFSISDWKVKPMGATISQLKASMFNDGSEELIRPKLDYTFSATRHIQFYWWKVLSPLMVILFLSWAVFWIDPEQVGAQIGIAGTSILTLIAFLYRLDNLIPPVSYLTHMDHFIFATLMMVFLAYLEALISTTLAFKGKKQIAVKLDYVFRIAYPIAFIFIVYMYWIR